MANVWVVRAGEGSAFAGEFERQGYVGIGYDGAGDFTHISDLDAMRARIAVANSDSSPQARATWAGQAFKFRSVMAPGDRVITYDGDTREYLLGTITGDYEYRDGVLSKFNHLRSVSWQGRVPKDVLRRTSNNTLGAILTIFDPGPDVLMDIEDALRTGRTVPPRGTEARSATPESLADLVTEFRQNYVDTERGRAHRHMYEESVAIGRRNFANIVEARNAGQEMTDAVLRKLLPHTDSKAHRASGEWIHIAPAVTKDVKSWYEGAGWAKPEDWPAKAAAVLDFVERLNTQPDDLAAACTEFSASRVSHGLQAGMLTPILNALRPDRFSIVNSKVVKAMAAIAGRRLKPTIGDYPEVNSEIRQFVADHSAALNVPEYNELGPGFVFDAFCHWFIAEREAESDDESPEPQERLKRDAMDRESADHARRVAERLCPDPAPRATAIAHFAKAVEFAHLLSPTAWSVTLNPHVMRLNVGGIVAVDLRRNGLYLIVHEPSIPAAAQSSVEQFDQDEDWRYLEGADGYLIPYSTLDPAMSLLKAANDELIRRAIDKSDRAPFRKAHSSGILKYLRECGFDVPDPAYAESTPTTPSSPQVREPPATPYATRSVFSLEDCASDTSIPATTLEKWVRAVNRKGQAILYGPPGTGKTFIAERLARHLAGGGDGVVDLVQFHPAYSYEDFIQGLRPKAGPGGQLTFELVPGRFQEFCREAASHSGTSVLVIDEINRANLSQVFGELMYLLEYRDKEIPLSGSGRLRIPPNVRIIGTMNTADRSIALVDHALRRRFAFIRLDPQFEVLERFHAKNDLDVSGLVATLQRLNAAIGNPHYSVGISFFMRETIRDDLEAVWTNEIEPYLDEYFFDRPEAVDEFRWARVRERTLV